MAVSTADEFTTGSSFHRVLWDDAQHGNSDTKLVADDKIKRVVMCSGKVYFDLLEERDARGIDYVYLMRYEQFYPFPAQSSVKELERFKNAEMVWCQEEPKNQGAWSFIEPNIEWVLGRIGAKHGRPEYAGRPAAGPLLALLLTLAVFAPASPALQAREREPHMLLRYTTRPLARAKSGLPRELTPTLANHIVQRLAEGGQPPELGIQHINVGNETYLRILETEYLGRILQGGASFKLVEGYFGGGKTHSMLALWHLFSEVKPAELPGIEGVLKEAGVKMRHVPMAGDAGAITAALFLQHFTGDVPWAHLDVASVGDSPSESFEWTAGPTGFGARALLTWLGSPEPLAGIGD